MINTIINASSRYPIRRKFIKAVIKKTLERHKVSSDVELEINICGDRKMKQLNKNYLKREGTTDVIAFPLTQFSTNSNKRSDVDGFIEYPDGVLRLGTIFISYPQARRQANDYRLLVDQEIEKLVEHGLLHLLGIHHV